MIGARPTIIFAGKKTARIEIIGSVKLVFYRAKNLHSDQRMRRVVQSFVYDSR